MNRKALVAFAFASLLAAGCGGIVEEESTESVE